MIGLGLSVVQIAVRQLLGFDPKSLFAASEPGVWYDPSDFSTMFQDAAGTTPVTAVEQPVGLILDKSKGLVLGPELVTNGAFDTDISGWAISVGTPSPSWSSGRMLLSGNGQMAQAISVVSGKRYQISVDITVTSGTGGFGIGTVSNNAGVFFSGYSGTSRTVTASFLATTSTVYAIAATNAISQTYFDNISVRELPGFHATQTTATSRPVLSARYNLIESTEKFVALRWTRSNTAVSVNATDAPNGELSAAKLSATATTSTHALAQGLTVQSGVAYRFSCYLKAGEETTASLWQNVNGGTLFDLVAGTVISGLAQATIEPVGNGWFLCSVPYTPSSTSGLVQIYPRTTASYTGDGTSGIYIWGASLTPANQASLPYQRVDTATDYDADPSKFKPYLRFDGVDDWLVTPTITPGTDKAQVFAGVRKLSDAAAYGVIAETSISSGALNKGSFVLTGPGSAADTYFASCIGSSSGSSSSSYDLRTYTAPISNVVTVLFNVNTANRVDQIIPRVNAATPTVSGGVAGAQTGIFSPYPLYIGRRGGTTLPFNGHLYGLIVRFGANLPAGTIASTETWLNQRTGAY